MLNFNIYFVIIKTKFNQTLRTNKKENNDERKEKKKGKKKVIRVSTRVFVWV